MPQREERNESLYSKTQNKMANNTRYNLKRLELLGGRKRGNDKVTTKHDE